MKKYLYEMTISVLIVSVGISLYLLYSEKEIDISKLAKNNKAIKPIDIKNKGNVTITSSIPRSFMKDTIIDAYKEVLDFYAGD